MSDFWNASEPPAITGLKEWCEKEVETACSEMADSVSLMAWIRPEGISVEPYFGDPWEIDRADKGAEITDMLWEAVQGHICHAYDPNRAHIDPNTGPIIAAALDRLEAKIAEARALFRAPPTSDL